MKKLNKNKLTFKMPYEDIRGISLKESNSHRSDGYVINAIQVKLDISSTNWGHDHVYVIQQLIKNLEQDCEEKELSSCLIQLEYIRNLFQEMENKMADSEDYSQLIENK